MNMIYSNHAADVLESDESSIYDNPPNSPEVPPTSQAGAFVKEEQMKEVCRRLSVLESGNKKQEADIDNLRATVRRLRFASDVRESRYRRDSLFYESVRRRFLQFWDGNPAVFNAIPSPQLAMLLLLLDVQKPLNA